MNIKNERGAVAVLVSVMMVLIIVCVAFVTDMGQIHDVKVRLQEAVDSAALAGARQLDGSINAVQNAYNAAKLTATANGVTIEDFTDTSSGCTTNPDSSCVGDWDETALGSSASTRFSHDDTSPEAVLVRANLSVQPTFSGLFTGDTVVTADAIAIATPVNPISPLALVSCIPTTEANQNAGSLPSMTICDVALYNFTTDQDDTAAWTSLTFDANANDIKDYLQGDEGKRLFNQVVFGLDLGNDGIENTGVDSSSNTYNNNYEGCIPDELNIPCGLGEIANKEVAPPDDFSPPSPFPDLNKDANTGIYNVTAFDPLTTWGTNNSDLPRWYNLNNDGAFDNDDYFSRMWTQDGLLLIGDKTAPSAEDFDQYQARLNSYYDSTDPNFKRPYNDGRFVKDENNLPFITEISGNILNKIQDALRDDYPEIDSYSKILWPDPAQVAIKAGYPQVGVLNGSASDLIATFLSNEDISNGTDLLCEENKLSDSRDLISVRVQVPVIFAGFCENWKALANNSQKHSLPYIGLAKFLVTRAWKNPNDYACNPPDGLNVGECTGKTWDPSLAAGNTFGAVNFNTPGALEGVNLFPTPDDEEEQASLIDVYLVE